MCVWMTVMLDGGQNLQRSKNSLYQSVMLWSNNKEIEQNLMQGHLTTLGYRCFVFLLTFICVYGRL